MTEHPKEHGLLFKPDMVRAYLASRKSQTRRVITRHNSYIDGGPAYKRIWDGLQFDKAWVDPGPSPAGNEGPYLKVPRLWIENGKIVDETIHRVYPKFQVGDTIWGRECWAVGRGYDGVPPRDLPGPEKVPIRVSYRADPENEWSRKHRGAWRPSIYMPRFAARIVTPIVAVRPERVQDISEDDAIAEGIRPQPGEELLGAACRYPHSELFRDLWDSINGKRFPWNSNQLVWVISFKRYGEEA